MKPSLRFCSSLWTLLVFSALLKSTHADCNTTCGTDVQILTTTANISVTSGTQCTLSTGNITGNGLITGLIPGNVYEVNFSCFNCCKNITTNPAAVKNLFIVFVTTSSVKLNWAKADGNADSYKIQWFSQNNGFNQSTTNETTFTIEDLVPGVHYNITVTAVANSIEGEAQLRDTFTKPEMVGNLAVSGFTTSSVFVTWSKPLGESSYYTVKWTNQTANFSQNVYVTETNVTDLTPGVKYCFAVTAVAGDNITESDVGNTCQYTKPEMVRNLTVSGFTTSSVFVNWTKPEGNSSFYRVHWRNGEIRDSVNVSETFRDITNLTAGVQYEISVTAVAADGRTEGQRMNVFQYTKPEAVSLLRVSAVTTTSIFVIWNKPNGNRSFYSVNWTDGTNTQSASETGESRNITGLTAGVQYTITVTPVAVDGTVGASISVSKYTKPGNIQINNVSATTVSIFLNWTAPDGYVSSYKVTWQKAGDSQLLFTNNTFVLLSNLSPGTNYIITISAIAGANNTEGEPFTVTKPTNPAAVKNLFIVFVTTTSVKLNWTKADGNADSYKIQWFSQNNGSNQSTTNETTYTIKDLVPGVHYNITVTAVANSIEGEAQLRDTFTKPEMVGNLAVSGFTTSSVFVNWTKPDGNSSFYRVQWRTGEIRNSVNVSETFRDITNLTAGVQYEISVTAVAADGRTEGQRMNVFQYTKPEAVSLLTVSAVTTTSIFVIWNKPNGNRSFYSVNWTDGTNTQSASETGESRNITGLTAGVQYTITVTPVAVDGTVGASISVSKYTKPGPVGNLTVSGFTTSSVSLNWTKPLGESSYYTVKWTNQAANFSQNVSVTETNVTDLTPGVKYCFAVTAVAGDNITESDVGNTCQYTKPEMVRNLAVSGFTTSSVFVNWTKPEGNSSFYRVQWRNGEIRNSVNVSETFRDITNLTAGVQYEISVTAVAADGRTEGQRMTVFQYTKPEAVSLLTVSAVTTTSIFVIWNKPNGNRSFYSVNWTDGTNTQSASETGESRNITGLTAGVQYTITVTPVAVDGTVGASISVSKYTKPGAVRNLTVTGFTTSSVSLNWSKPLGERSYYTVKWTNQTANFSQNVYVTETNVTDLTPGVKYCFAVTAVAGDNITESDVGNTCQYTKPGAVRNLTVTGFTTSSVSLNWSKPLGESSYYTVKWTNQAANFSQNVYVTETNVTDLTPGVKYCFAVTAVAGDNITESDVRNTCQYTKPGAVRNLTVTGFTTSSVSLNWSKPLGESSYYTVKWTNQTANFSQNVSVTETNVTDLTPGVKYCFAVTAVAGDNITESDVGNTCQYTTPGQVSNITAIGTTTTLTVNWTKAPGQVSSYSVNLYRDRQLNQTTTLSNDTLSFVFGGLKPGVLYCVDVVTISGPVQNNHTVCNATFPNPPGVITVDFQTVQSINFTWQRPADMDQNQYNFSVSSGNFSNQTTNNWYLLENLQSGSPNNISVVTVGVFGYTSTAVTARNYTRPYSVTNLTQATITTDSVTLVWDQPERKSDYSYEVKVIGSPGRELVNIITNTTIKVDNLQSGSNYSFTVTTQAADGTRAEPRTISYFTRPFSVTNLTQTEITTHSVTLVWEQPDSKSNYTYEVKVKGPDTGSPISVTVNITTNTTIKVDNLQSGSNYSFTVTTQAADGTQAEPRTVYYFTRPYGVTDLRAETLNTSAIFINWTKPLQYRNDYMYQVVITCCNLENRTLPTESITISELTPGTNYIICVLVMAANGINGEKHCTTQYTKPETVLPSVSNQGSNSSVLVSWTKPYGNVERYKVHLNSSQIVFTIEKELSPNITSFLFTNLSAGVLYGAILSTCSGPFNQSSDVVINATYPNPPGPIEILNKTTSSIVFIWGEAPLMTKTLFYYNTQIQREQNITTSTAVNTTFTFSNLSSGTSYNISVRTVGPMNFTSESVTSNMITTRPHRVNSLNATPQVTSIGVNWTKPVEYKDSYYYNLTWQWSDGMVNNSITYETNYLIRDLQPGSQYNISVTTVTSDGTRGASTRINICTDASPVTNLTCTAPNLEEAQIFLTWNKPDGQSSGFQVVLGDSEPVFNSTASCCSQNVSRLKHYTEYKVTVMTQSCGHPSTPVNLTCRTGITNPQIPANFATLVSVKDQNTFTVQINRSLLDNTNGPITNVGVLVKRSSSSYNSNLTYLGKTYADWSKGSTPVYLATVIPITSQSRSIQDLQTKSTNSSNNPISIVIGNGAQWEGYLNGPLTAGESYQYAVVMFTYLESSATDQGTVNSNRSLYSITPFSEALQLDKTIDTIAIVIGVTLGVFGVFFIILMGFIIYWKRVSKKEASDIQIHSVRAKVSAAVRVEDYEAYYKKQKADSNCGFAEEFEDMKIVGTAQAKIHALSLENKPKNRYNNVLPYDSSRVKLSIVHGNPHDDYINANYMPGYLSRKEFIAAQGPLPTTVNEFWRMIWEKNAQTLVMLTRCNEQGRVKCEQYWGRGTKHFDNITVTTTSEIPLDDWTIRDFSIKNVKTAEVRLVRHFHFTAWPDHGVPETTELLISFRHLVREHMNQYSKHSPTVVHCSAGVGRTGTFIAIDRLIFQIERENIVDVFGIVYDLRMHRPLMVQTEDQYVFLNQCALDVIRSRTGTNVDLIYQNAAALSIYENIEPKKGFPKQRY
ncbi:receptor-type tyrosine-protein phosphatase eta isoform X2 [Melanotaenia boesemani]|uniref:receptor-type tyrosine-protein phosphatase eta isoform X2 n=1 Tax=Melanotaenia boesemani TaxID=1250792 RepID=UPI001C0556C5|nr:receptor-type tyrosine-protein phosphatase eta isoform X2 [Melanotaenia boesemani]